MLALWIAACGHRESPPPAPGGVVVLVSVDQLPARQLALVRPLLAPDGGFARLTGDAAFHADAAHTHAVTQTCPGHATLVTGASPAVHGIVGNRWIDAAGKTVYCADPDGDGTPDPGALLVSGIADQVVAAGGRAVSVGLKDRAPVLMGGATPSAVVWFDRKALAFTGPDWARLPVAFDAGWEAAQPKAYAAIYPDDQPFESADFGGRTFPHPPPADADAWLRSPGAGHTLTDLAIAALDHAGLGAGARPDLLAVGYSQTDYIGHTWGAESWEYLDALVALDRDLARLMSALDTRFPGRWTLVLSSDHGVTPAAHPRVDPEPLLAAARAAAHAAGAPDAELGFEPPHVYLPPGTPAEVRGPAARAVAASLRAAPGVSGAWAWQVDPPEPHLATSLYAPRAGEVYVQLAEDRQWLWGDGTGADHGGPWPADQQVPLLATGRGIRPGTASQIVDTRAIAPTLAVLLGVAPPPHAEFPALSNVEGP